MPVIGIRRHTDEEADKQQVCGRAVLTSASDDDFRLRASYLTLTDFVLTDVRPKYQAAGVRCGDAAVAAITATLFIASCRREGIS